MIGWIVTIMGAVAAGVLHGKVQTEPVFWIAVVMAVTQFWSFGVLANYRRSDRAPPAVAVTNTITTIGCVGMLVYAIVA